MAVRENHYAVRQTRDFIQAHLFDGSEEAAELIRVMTGGEEAHIRPNPWADGKPPLCIVKIPYTDFQKSQYQTGHLLIPPMHTGIFACVQGDEGKCYYFATEKGEWGGASGRGVGGAFLPPANDAGGLHQNLPPLRERRGVIMNREVTSDDLGMAVIFVVLAPVLSLASIRFGMWVLDEAGRQAAAGEVVGSWIAYAVLFPVGAIIGLCVGSGLMGLLTVLAWLVSSIGRTR